MDNTQTFEAFVNKTPYQNLRNKNCLICYHRPDGQFFRVSENAKQIIGYSPEELIGENSFDYYHPEDKTFIRRKAHEVALSEGFSDSVVYRFRHRDGSYVIVETITSVLRDSSGNAKILSTMTWLHNQD